MRVIEYTRNRPWRTRRTPTTKAAQGMTQLLQEALLPNTHDLHVRNFLLSLLPQIIGRLGVDPVAWSREVALLDRLANKRDELCEKVLKLPLAEGSVLLQQTIEGVALPPQFENNAFLHLSLIHI